MSLVISGKGEQLNMKKKKKSTFWKDFKAFISKGSVLDLAVATIIGAAFGQIVTSFTQGIIMPLVSLLFKAENLDSLTVKIGTKMVEVDGVMVEQPILWQYGALLQAVINFLIIALFLFVLIRIVRKTQKAFDVNTRMKETIQAKLNNDEPLTEAEEKWMAIQAKHDPDEVPVKQVVAPSEPSSTDKLLAEILEELKKENK